MMNFPTLCVLAILGAPALALAQSTDAQSTEKATQKASTTSVKHTQAQITFKVKDAGVTVSLDGKPVGDSPLPGPWTVSPGDHVVRFIVAGKTAAEIKLSVKKGEQRVVHWPDPATTGGDTPSRFNWAPWSLSDVGVAVTVGGIAAVALGGYFGAQAVELADEAGNMVTTETFRVDFERLTQQSSDAALAANLSYGVGAAALISGLVMAVFGDGGMMSVGGDEDEAVIIIGGNF
jgi:hypothetical protein